MYYRIKPLDTLFFRDGRPFSMGSETWAEPIFPPYPSTVYGAIRAWLISEKGGYERFKKGELEQELGTPSKKGSMRIIGPIVALDNVPYFPVPNDLLKEKGGDKTNIVDIIPKNALVISDYELEYLLLNKTDKQLDEAEGFLWIGEIKDYLSGRKEELNITENKKIYEKELKTGIKRSRKTLTSEEGHLYRIPMIRIKEKAGLIVKIEGVSHVSDEGVIQLGGEGKAAKIEKIGEIIDILKEIENIELNSEIFKIYLATPAIFEKGWIPNWINESSFEGQYNGIKLKLIACSIGKYKLIGGWDMAKRKPKPMYKAVPAGSVYYFKILDNTPSERIKKVFHLKNISDINSEEGYGLCLVGNIKTKA